MVWIENIGMEELTPKFPEELTPKFPALSNTSTPLVVNYKWSLIISDFRPKYDEQRQLNLDNDLHLRRIQGTC